MAFWDDIGGKIRNYFVDPQNNVKYDKAFLTGGTALAGALVGANYGVIEALIGVAAGSLLPTVIESFFTQRDPRFDRTMKETLVPVQQQVTEWLGFGGPSQQRQRGTEGSGQETDQLGRILAPMLEKLKPPPDSLAGVIQERTRLLNNIHEVKSEEDWKRAEARLHESETHVNRFMVNTHEYLRNRADYYTENGARNRAIKVLGDLSAAPGRHRLTHELTARLIPELPNLDSLNSVITITRRGRETHIPIHQAFEDYQNGRGEWAVPEKLLAYGSALYTGEKERIKNEKGEELLWTALTTDQKLCYIQKKLTREFNEMGHGACRKLPASLAGGTARDIDLESITRHSGVEHERVFKNWIEGLEKEKAVDNPSSGWFKKVLPFYAAGIKVALEKKQYGIAEHIANNARAYFQNNRLNDDPAMARQREKATEAEGDVAADVSPTEQAAETDTAPLSQEPDREELMVDRVDLPPRQGRQSKRSLIREADERTGGRRGPMRFSR